MRHRERVKLLFGPYQSPPLRRGDRAICHVRDCDVVVTGWSGGSISWPRCRALDSNGAGSGIRVDEELVRAIRHESAVALRYWWGVSVSTVAKWRRSLGIRRAEPEGSARLIQAAAEAGADALRGKPLPPEQVECRRKTTVALNLKRFLRLGFHGRWWTRKELKMLGTAPDSIVAARIGRSPNAVRVMRSRLGIPRAPG
jgi:hypothetical protein